MATTLSSASPASETAGIVLRMLEQSPEPLGLNQIAKGLTGPFRRNPDELQAIVDELVARGVVRRFPPYRRKLRYWTGTLDDFARSRILHALAQRPRTRSELEGALKVVLAGVPKSKQAELLRELVRSGEVHKLPPYLGARTERFSARPADPREYVSHALDKLIEKLSPAGIGEEQLLAACSEVLEGRAAPSQPVGWAVPTGLLSNPDTSPVVGAAHPTSDSLTNEIQRDSPPRNDWGESIVERMRAIEPAAARGALVSIPELRRQPEFRDLDKPAFDRIVLELGRQERVALHRHDYPASLSEDERRQFVLDERGRHYNGISLRT
ncbi:MAG: hypothetical protein WD069_05850 [Planctomycetales bacterium]